MRIDLRPACADLDPVAIDELFFGRAEEAHQAAQFCRNVCPVVDACRAAADHLKSIHIDGILQSTYGVWGGETARERNRLRKAATSPRRPQKGAA